MEDTFNFQFTETLQSSHPLITQEFEFIGTATWVEGRERFAINKVFCAQRYAHLEIPGGFTPLEILEAQEEDHTLDVFLSKCRTAAHKAATEAGFFDSENENQPVQHNAGFVPKSNDLSYMNNDGDISFPETQSRQQ